MNRMSGEEDKKVVNLDQFRKEKFSLKIILVSSLNLPQLDLKIIKRVEIP